MSEAEIVNLESAIINEYQRLAATTAEIASQLRAINSGEMGEMSEDLATLENKLSLVYTLVRSSVFSNFYRPEDIARLA
ncbi:unnamed protein product [Kuraishia capsulata CBS 1993]|uniref:DASH complex subunit DAD3 n=1 Tax=Kuraishia capsulata CBS 1993 TaxID=1382522 RepID=W6MW83_9ASCO|nr:uncharacterized protein KUCA_T00002972001 [Kuraishia capsulata CBS 1993]CDK26995.1 unnamed protein product [Kuraishia capsulata CBS 1993]